MIRRWLLVACFLLAQIGFAAHAAEHLRGEADAPAGHVCVVCLAGHGLDGVLPTTLAPLAMSAPLLAGALAVAVAGETATPFGPPARGPPCT